MAGVRTERRTVQAFVLAGALSAASGCLSVMILGASSPTVGLGSLLPAFAGAFLGATSIRPGRFNAAGTLIAVYLVATGITGLQQLGAQPFVQQLFNGVALLVAVTLARVAAVRRRGA
jgi:ribose transport system permease protein